MSLFSPLLIVCLDPETAGDLPELARSLGYSDGHIVQGGFKEAVAALNSRTTSPDYIIVDIGNRGTDILEELDEFSKHCEANVRVVIIGAINDIMFYRELKQRGILEYFTRPASPASVRAILMQGPTHYQSTGPASTQGTVISFMSAASGDGASTLAINFAYSLAEQMNQPTVLVDMDYQFGLISKSLDLSAPFGIRELFDHPDRGLDEMLISKMLVKYKDNLSIIASPSDLRLLPHIRPELIRDLIGILRSQFAFVVIDVPHVWTDWTAAALTYSTRVFMVAQLWLRSLTHASRLLASWHSIGIDRDDISVVINRSGAKFKEGITAEDFERICRHRIEAHVNNDVKAITFAENHAKTLFEAEQGEKLQQQITQIAQSISARYQGHAASGPMPGGPKKGLRALLEKKKT